MGCRLVAGTAAAVLSLVVIRTKFTCECPSSFLPITKRRRLAVCLPICLPITEVIIVDSNSNDGTPRSPQEWSACDSGAAPGYGQACLTGLAAAIPLT